MSSNPPLGLALLWGLRILLLEGNRMTSMGLGSSSFYFISYGSGYIAQDGFNFLAVLLQSSKLLLQVCLTMSFQTCLKHEDDSATTSAAVTLTQAGHVGAVRLHTEHEVTQQSAKYLRSRGQGPSGKEPQAVVS